MAWILAAITVIVFLYLFRLTKKKKSPPGPIALPLFGHFHLLGHHPPRSLYHLAQKYGPIMGLRFGFVPTVVISSPAAAELVLKTNDLIFAGRPSQLSDKYITNSESIVFKPYGTYWRQIKKLFIVKMMNTYRIEQNQGMRKAELGLFIEKLKQAANRRETVDLAAGLFGLSLDINCLMVFGKKFSDGDLNDEGFVSIFAETSELGASFNLADYFPYIEKLDLQGLHKRMKKVSKVFDEFLEKIIDDHVEDRGHADGRNTEDFLDTLLSVMETGEGGLDLDRIRVKAILMNLLIGGTDTSSTTVAWAFSELMRNPHIMTKLKKELELEVGMNQMVNESHLEKLKYLNCVIKETFRLHPPVPLLLPHASMEDCVIDGFFVPKKSKVIINMFAIGRDPNVWHDPENFSPDRFVGSDIDVKGNNFELIPFGAGRRRCPGMQIGLVVTRLLLAQLVHCFDWELPNGMKPSDMDMSDRIGIVMRQREHIRVIPTYKL